MFLLDTGTSDMMKCFYPKATLPTMLLYIYIIQTGPFITIAEHFRLVKPGFPTIIFFPKRTKKWLVSIAFGHGYISGPAKIENG